MNLALVFLMISLQWTTGFADVNDVTQPPNIMLPVKENATLTCSHTKSATYDRMYWFRQHQGKTMELIVYTTSYGTVEYGKLEKTKYSVNHKSALKGDLTVKNLESDDNALYLCAVIKTGGDYQAYFGNGTKLTVLERNLSIPNSVEILKPSGIETGCKKKVTLVCVVRNFYPDHVSIRWTLGGIEIKDDVATDPYAIQDKDTKLFSISSRLQVSKKQFKPKHNYTCTMRFYNETDKYQNISGSIIGIEGDEYEPENYVNSAQWMKLAYGVFIAKSGLYGLVVLVYVMRKGSSGK